MEKKKLCVLIPETMRNPFVFLSVIILPQLFLWVSLFRAWSLLKGELSAENIAGYHWIIIFHAILIVGAGGMTVFLCKRKMLFNWICGLIFFGFQAALAYGMFYQVDSLTPSGTPVWMFNVGSVIFMMAVALTPGLFYSLLNVAGINLPFKKGKDFLYSFLGLIIIPTCYYLCMIVLSQLSYSWSDILDHIMMIMFILGTAITFVLFFRCILHLYRLYGNKLFIKILACLVFPIAGLILNIVIPFPANLQDWTVYALTIINAGVILIPTTNVANTKNILIYCARCIMFTFTLYFFLLFLPFLPLSIVAMIIFGAGFLILAPTFLFFIHGRLIVDEGKVLAQRFGFLKVIILFVVMISVLPAIYTARAFCHKNALMTAVDVVYHPDYSVAQPKVNTYAVEKALKRLQAMNAGIYVPILSEYYNKIVFNNMVLPQNKIDKISEDLLGKNISSRFNKETQMFDMFTSGSTGRSRSLNRKIRPPRHVNVTGLGVVSKTMESFTSSEVIVSMKNAKGTRAEFECEVDLPEGVLISNYWLDVNGKEVDGTLFDRKSAEWVYGMIRDTTPRDPGLVVYKDRDTIKLNVYPFESYQERQCGFTFIYPSMMKVDFSTVSNSLRIVSSSVAEETLRPPIAAGEELVLISKGATESLPTVVRKPYYHIMIDVSKQSANQNAWENEILESFVDKIGDNDTKVTLVNYGSYDLSDGQMVNSSEVVELVDKAFADSIKFKGGFNLGRALKRAVLEYDADDSLYDRVPIYIVVGAGKPLVIGSLDEYQRLKPDTPIYLNATNFTSAIHPNPIHLMNVGDDYSVIETGKDIVLIANGSDVSCFEQATGLWLPIASEIVTENSLSETYIKGMKLWNDYTQMAVFPETLSANRRQLLAQARDCGILYPEVAYIVLENSAQIEFLKLAEKQALDSNDALEFDAPAPGLLFLLVPFMLWQFVSSRRKKRPN